MSADEFEFDLKEGDSNVWIACEIARCLLSQPVIIGEGYLLSVYPFGPTGLPYTRRSNGRLDYRTANRDRAHDWIVRAALAGYQVYSGDIGLSISGRRRYIARKRKEAEAMKHIPKSVRVRPRAEEPKPEGSVAIATLTEEPTTQRPGFAERKRKVLGVLAEVAAEIFKPVTSQEFDAARDAAKAKSKPHPEFG